MTQGRNNKSILAAALLICAILASAVATTGAANSPTSAYAGSKLPAPTATAIQNPKSKIQNPNDTINYGFLMALLGNNAAVRNMGFGWVSYGIFWSDEETSRGQYSWLSGANNVDNIADAARTANVNVLIRISRTPEWARASDCISNWDTCPPEDPDDFGTFAGALAQRVRSRLTGQQVAYEIWNEPNVSNEWGDMCPDPARYTELLRAAYPRIKARDASATVAGGAITTVAEIRAACHIDDLLFIQGMYNAGAAPYFDVLADHPYGFISAPEADPVTSQSGLVFRRAERHRAYMVANGDAHKKIWATELGWAINPATEGYNCPPQEVQWYQVFNQQQQADYLVRAHQWARSYWPWMGAMFTWNFDFDEAPWYPECNSFRFYGVKNRLARPALQSFVQNPPPTYTPVAGTPLPTATPIPSATPVDGPPVITSVRYNRVNFTRDGGSLSIDLDARDSGPAAIDTAHVLVTYPNNDTQLLSMTLISGTIYSGTWHLDFNIPANYGPSPLTYTMLPYVVEDFPPRRTTMAPSQQILLANTRFWDVPADFWAYSFIESLANAGAIGGYNDGSFQPANNATRAQLSKIVVLAFGYPLQNPPNSRFQDVVPGSTFYQYVETAAAQSLVSGYNCGGAGEPCVPPLNKPYFRPNNSISRAQISKIVTLAAGWPLLNPPVSTFQDVAPGSTFYQYVETAYAHGILSGYPCGNPEPCVPPGDKPYFRPNSNASRAQIAKMVHLASNP
ncbi:MAG: S-layer homology domain-containing protein, partial [Chloroflexia bacterium]